MWSGPHENNYKKRRDGQHDVTDGGTIKDALKCLSFCSVLLGIYSSLHISHLWYTASHVSHVYMGPTQTHTGYIYCTTRNPSSILHSHHRPTPPSGCTAIIKTKTKKVRELVSERWKSRWEQVMCVQRYRKMDFICSDLNSYVVLSGLQHKTLIINLWIEPF